MAFIELDKARFHGGTGFPQPITIAEIKACAEVRGFSRKELPELSHYVRVLDTIYLRLQAEKQKRESRVKKK